MTIYLDNAATTVQKPVCMKQTILDVLESERYGNPARGAHSYSIRAYQLIEMARDTLKNFFHTGDLYEIIFSGSVTIALNAVLKGFIQAGDHVLTTSWEHNSVLRPLYQLEKLGVSYDIISSHPITGQLNYEEFTEKLNAKTKVVVCNHASNVTGNLLDIEWIKRFCHKHQLYLILDISQTAGHLPIDLSDGKVAAACFTGHKALHGPQGTGGICIHKKMKLTPIITGGDGMKSFSKEQPDELPAMLEAGTANVPGIAGLAASVGWLMSQETPSLGNYFYQEATKISELTFYGDFTKEHIDVFSLNIRSAESALISDILWEEFGIATRSGYHCSPLIHQDLGTKNTGTVRVSLSRFTTEEEIEKTIKALRIIAKR